MNPPATPIAIVLMVTVILFIIFMVVSPCSSSSCGCGSGKSSAGGAASGGNQAAPAEAQAEAAGAEDASGEPESEDAAAEEEGEEAPSGLALAADAIQQEAMGEVVDLGAMDLDVDTTASRTRLERARKNLTASLAAAPKPAEIPSGASLDQTIDELSDVDAILDLQRAADAGDEQAEARLDALLARTGGSGATGEFVSGAASTASSTASRGHQKVSIPMTADEAKRMQEAGDLTARLGADFWASEAEAKKKRGRARFLETLAAENPDKATEIMRVAGAAMVLKPTNASMQSAKRRRRERVMAAFDEADQVATGNDQVRRGEAATLPPVSSFAGREVPAEYQRRTAMIRADDPHRQA